MTVSIVNTWTGGYAPPAGFVNVGSATGPAQVTVANTAGDWMIAVAAWQQPAPGFGTSMAASDDVHNWWEPAGGDSPAAGLVRCSLWAAPAAQAAGFFQACPTMAVTSVATAVYDVAGIGAGWAPQAVASASGTGTSLVIGGGTAASQSLVITVFGSAQSGATVTPPAGWTPLTGSAIPGGVASQSITVAVAYQVITGAIPSATWGVSGSAVALGGVTVAIPLAAVVPALKSPDWPAVITEAAIGSGPQTPPARMTWTDMSARALALSVQQGRQYSLSQLQAAQGTLTLDNPDGALIPPGAGPFAGIDSGTPLRRRCYWPGGAWQVQWSGNGVTANPGAQSQLIGGIVALRQYQASALMGSPQGWAQAQLAVNWFTAGGVYISTGTGPLVSVPAGGSPVTVATGPLTAPATATQYTIVPQMAGTPASSVIMQAAAGGQPAGYLTAVPLTWTPNNAATVTTLAAWATDPRGAPSVTPWSVPFSGYFRRWPFTAPDVLRGLTVAEVSDIWAYATGTLNSMARQEMLLDGPYALWPLDDAAGAVAASNIAPGNSNPLQLITAKLGAGGAVQQWGQNSGALAGDGSALVTQSGKQGGGSGDYQLTLAGTSLNTQGYGYALTCYDAGLPQLSGGVTVETWFTTTANTNTTGNGFSNSGNVITVTGSNFPNGTPVVFAIAGGFTLPTGMTAGVIYYVIAASGATFQISTTIGGGAVTLSTNGAGFCATTTVFNPVILALRNAAGSVFSVQVRATDGSLFVSGRTVATTTVDTSRDWRVTGGLIHLSVALTSATWRVMLDGGGISTSSGSLTSSVTWGELALGGEMDRVTQGFCLPGQLKLAVVYPYVLPQNRVEAHYFAGLGLPGDPASTRVDRVLAYAGLAGRRWIGQPTQVYELDFTPTGKDIGGQSPAASAGNVATSTAPAILAIAPTGDITYIAKQYSWNKAIRWVLGDNTAGGEIPFSLAQFSTDYDPTRVYNQVQLTQLDTQSVTVPSGATATTTVAAMTAASQRQYGQQPYQQTAYLTNDYLAPYIQGSGLTDLAAWIAMIYGKPRNRVPGVTVNAAAYPSAWPLWLTAAVGDMVQVNLRLPTAATSPVVSVIARVTQTRRSMKWDLSGAPVATIDLTLDAAPEYNALTCDDAVRGLLNGTNVLAW